MSAYTSAGERDLDRVLVGRIVDVDVPLQVLLATAEVETYGPFLQFALAR